MNTHLMLQKILSKEKFFDTFANHLDCIFGVGTWLDVETYSTDCSTNGWDNAFETTLNEFDLNEVYESYNNLDLVASDEFDLIISKLLIANVINEEGQYKYETVKCYTPIWNDFQIRDVQYIDGHIDLNRFDVVKWHNHVPIEVTDWKTGRKRLSSRSCYSIGVIEYDPQSESFDFNSVGLRFLEDYKEGLNEFILSFIRRRKEELGIVS